MSTIKFNAKNRAAMIGVQTARNHLVTNNYRHNITFSGTGMSATQTLIIDGLTFTASATVGPNAIVDAFVNGSSPLGTFSGSAANYIFRKSTAPAVGTPILNVIARPGVVPASVPVVTGTRTNLTDVLLTNILNARSVMAATALQSATQLQMGSVEFLGDALSRRKHSFTQDTFGQPVITTPEQILGTFTADSLAAALATQNSIGAGQFNLFRACGGRVSTYTISSMANTIFANSGAVIVDNSRAIDSLLTLDVRYSSPEDATGRDKIWTYFDLQGTLDISSSITELSQFTYNLNGNLAYPWIDTADRLAFTQVAPGLVADYGDQFLNISEPILPVTVRRAELIPLDDTFGTNWGGTFTYIRIENFIRVRSTVSHGITEGSIRLVRATADAADPNRLIYSGTFMATAISANEIMFTTINIPTANPSGTFLLAFGVTAAIRFSFGALNATNFFGFNIARFVTSEEQGFSRTGLSTEVNISLLMDQSWTASFDPNNNLSRSYAVQMVFGTTHRRMIVRQWEALQIANVTEGTIGEFNSSDITFNNTGVSRLIYY